MESFIILPVLSISSMPVGAASQAVVNVVNPPSFISFEQHNKTAALAINAIDREIEERKAKAEAIDSYFKNHDMPLAGTGMKMVLEAEKNDLDWRLLPAIAVRESTGGKFACKKVTFSAFGWGSCKINFKSHDQAIETVARNLGGNNPKTSHHYDEKTTKEILRAYNPPSIVPRYAEQVMSIMDTIGKEDSTELAIANS